MDRHRNLLGRKVDSRIQGALGTSSLERLPEGLRVSMAGLFGMVIALSEQMAGYDDRIEAMARERYPEALRLSQVPGVGILTAATFVLTMGDRGTFGRNREAGGYVGLRPRQQQSGERDPQLGITKAGDTYLRMLLVQAAHCIMRKHAPDTALKRWGMKLCARGGKNAKKRAVVAVARKLAVLLYRLWRTGESYRAFPVAQAA